MLLSVTGIFASHAIKIGKLTFKLILRHTVHGGLWFTRKMEEKANEGIY